MRFSSRDGAIGRLAEGFQLRSPMRVAPRGVEVEVGDREASTRRSEVCDQARLLLWTSAGVKALLQRYALQEGQADAA